MNRSHGVFMAAALVASAAFAMDDMTQNGMTMDMTAMDANHDGMLSKQEYMKGHEGMKDHEDRWTKMQKNKSGMVDMNEKSRMHNGTTNSGMQDDGGTMKDDGTMIQDKTGKQ